MSKKRPEEPEQSIKFTPEQMELIREGEEALDQGKKFTLEEVRARADKRTLAWLKGQQTA
jgi:hypothetical protein